MLDNTSLNIGDKFEPGPNYKTRETRFAPTYDTIGDRPISPSLFGGDEGARHIQSPTPQSRNDIPMAPTVEEASPAEDSINPAHYRRHPSGIECIEVTRHMNFNVGNAVKYLWRYMDKNNPVENLKKAQWYIDDEIRRLEGKR